MEFTKLNLGQLLGYGTDVIGYHEALKIIGDKNIKHPFFLISDGEISKMLNQVFDDHQNEKENDFYEMEVGDEVVIDIDALQAIVRRLIMIPTGSSIYFKGAGGDFTIRTKSIRYLIVTKQSSNGELLYSIIDTIGGLCGPYVQPSIPYDVHLNINNDNDLQQILIDLESGKLNVSSDMRIVDVIDLEKSFEILD